MAVQEKTGGARPAPPNGGSGVKPSPAQAVAADFTDELRAALKDLVGLAGAVERAVIAKGSQYGDAKSALMQARSDRALILSKIVEISREVPGVSAEGSRPGEGVYVAEADILTILRPYMVGAGLVLLPTVLQREGPDASGTTTVIVEYAIAHESGALWPAVVRVAGQGNDRVTRGGSGDKGMPRALTAAWKEAVMRLLLIGAGNDPEAFEAAHAAPAQSRPSDRRSAGEQREKLSLADEDKFKARVLRNLESFDDIGRVHEMMGRDDVRAKLKLVGSRTRAEIERQVEAAIHKLEREAHRRMDERERREAREVGGGRRGDDGPYDQAPEEESQDREDDRPPRGGYQEDDDIPF